MDEHTSHYHWMMDAFRRDELLRQIQAAKSDEDRAWTVAAEMRQKKVPDGELVKAIQLVEAATSARMKLEAQLRQEANPQATDSSQTADPAPRRPI